MKKNFFNATLALMLLLGLTVAAFKVQAQASKAPLTATEIMEQAKQQAKAENKNILLLFHASWCGWCKKMEASIMDKSCKDYFDSNFVITYVDVLETGSNVSLENPGGRQLLEEYGGAESGIPYWLIFSADGKLLADSKIHSADGSSPNEGQNMGCPAQVEEVEYFIGLLKQHSQMTGQQAAAIRQRFLKNAPASTQ